MGGGPGPPGGPPGGPPPGFPTLGKLVADSLCTPGNVPNVASHLAASAAPKATLNWPSGVSWLSSRKLVSMAALAMFVPKAFSLMTRSPSKWAATMRL